MPGFPVAGESITETGNHSIGVSQLPPAALRASGIGDGVTDNGPLWQAAYNAGRSILLGPGTYFLNTPIFDTNAGAYEAWVLEGSNGANILLGPNLPACSSFQGDTTFSPGDVTATWGIFLNTNASALVTPSTAAAWTANSIWVGGKIVTDGAGHLFACTTTGFSGSSTPSWVTTSGSTTSDGTVVWTCMGAQSAVDCGLGTSQRNSAASGLSHAPRAIFRNLALNGGSQNSGLVFGNGAAAEFDGVMLTNWKFLFSGNVSSDSLTFRNVNGSSAISGLGSITGGWLAYMTTNGGGDGPKFDACKLNGTAGYFVGQTVRGLTADACIGGAFWLKNCTGTQINGWHAEDSFTSLAVPMNPSLQLDRSSVTLRDCDWQPALTSTGNLFAQIVDDASFPAQGSQLILDGCHPAFFGRNTDFSRTPDITITSAGASMTVVQRSSQAGILQVGLKAYDCDSIVINSAIGAITTALTATTYGSQLALTATDFTLRSATGGTTWTVEPYSGLPGVRSYAAQAKPTNVSVGAGAGTLPVISSIVTNGTTWTITFATAHFLSAGAQFVTTGFSPGGYNGTFTVASVTSATVLVVTNATQPGTITTTGTDCSVGANFGTLTPGTSYDYTMATIDDDGQVSQAATDAARVCDATGVNAIFGKISNPYTNVIVWRATGTAGTVGGSPTQYQIIPVPSTSVILLDTGANVNGRAWLTSAIPVPNTAFATTTATAARSYLNGVQTFPATDSRNAHTGMYLFSPYCGAQASAQLQVGNTWRGCRFVPPANMTLKHLVFVLTVAATANDNMDIGLYTAAGAFIFTAGLTASILNGSLGRTSISLGAGVSLTGGTPYYVVFLPSTTGGTACTISDVSVPSSVIPQMLDASYEFITGTVTAGNPLPTTSIAPGFSSTGPLIAGLIT